jgi:hypothetical protein
MSLLQVITSVRGSSIDCFHISVICTLPTLPRGITRKQAKLVPVVPDLRRFDTYSLISCVINYKVRFPINLYEIGRRYRIR